VTGSTWRDLRAVALSRLSNTVSQWVSQADCVQRVAPSNGASAGICLIEPAAVHSAGLNKTRSGTVASLLQRSRARSGGR